MLGASVQAVGDDGHGLGHCGAELDVGEERGDCGDRARGRSPRARWLPRWARSMSSSRTTNRAIGRSNSVGGSVRRTVSPNSASNLADRSSTLPSACSGRLFDRLLSRVLGRLLGPLGRSKVRPRNRNSSASSRSTVHGMALDLVVKRAAPTGPSPGHLRRFRRSRCRPQRLRRSRSACRSPRWPRSRLAAVTASAGSR